MYRASTDIHIGQHFEIIKRYLHFGLAFGLNFEAYFMNIKKREAYASPINH